MSVINAVHTSSPWKSTLNNLLEIRLKDKTKDVAKSKTPIRPPSKSCCKKELWTDPSSGLREIVFKR